MNRYSILPLGAIAAIAIAGCGSSDSNKSSSATPASGAGANAYGSPVKAASTPSAGAAVVETKSNKLGTVLAGPKGQTLYLFEADKGGTSACSDACAKAWPPLTTSGSATAVKGAVAADLGTIKRADGTTQVTYKGHPLYSFIKDTDGEDAYGQGVKAFGAEWYVLAPSGSKIDEG